MAMNMVKAADKTPQKERPAAGLNLRYERKFICINDHLEDLVEELYLNSFCFSEIFEQRRINNVYFDDGNFNFYKQNVAGIGAREKYRLRWYGNEYAKIQHPTVEIKRKFGEVGDKLSHKLPGLTFELQDGEFFELKEHVIDHISDNGFLKNAFQLLHPSLCNYYDRRYFLSACGKFRITLDFKQRFYNPSLPFYRGTKKAIDDRIIILELKFGLNDDMEARSISQEFNSRVSRNSKYVQGIDLINGLPLF